MLTQTTPSALSLEEEEKNGDEAAEEQTGTLISSTRIFIGVGSLPVSGGAWRRPRDIGAEGIVEGSIKRGFSRPGPNTRTPPIGSGPGAALRITAANEDDPRGASAARRNGAPRAKKNLTRELPPKPRLTGPPETLKMKLS